MARITIDEYKIGRPDNQLKDAAIQLLALTPASQTIDKLLGVGLTEAVLKSAELYLALHLGAIADRRASSEGIPPASTSYEGQTQMGLDATTYGQQLRLLLGEAIGLLGPLDGPIPQLAKIWVVTAD